MAWTAAGARGVHLALLLVLSGCVANEPRPEPRFDVETTTEDAGGSALGSQVWGLRPNDTLPPVGSDSDSAADPLAPGQEPQGIGDQERASLRARFGSAIVIGDDGLVTKQYFLSGEAAGVFLSLVHDPAAPEPAEPVVDIGPVQIGGGEHSDSILGQMLGEQAVELYYLRNFEMPEGVPIREEGPGKPHSGVPPAVQTGAGNSLLLVTALPQALDGFESALNLFFANIPQVEIEIKVVEYTTSDTLAFGVSTVDPNPTLENVNGNTLVQNIVSEFPLTAPFLGTSSVSDQGIITLGGIHNSWALNAQLQALQVAGVADVLTSPRLVVRNGGLASIVTKTELPYPKASISSSGQNITADIAFKKTGVTLNIRPVIAGTDTVILQIFASVAAVTSFATTEPIDTPIISSREVVTSVHVGHGQTTVIGGLVQHSQFENTSQFPILGDIPIIGYLFRSTSTTENQTTLEFHITPRVIESPASYFGSE